MKVRRGDIVTVELTPTEGSDTAGYTFVPIFATPGWRMTSIWYSRQYEQQCSNRPCVAIQNDVGNQYSPTTIVAPFTKQYDPDEIYPFEVEVLASNTALNHDSVADISQIRVVDISERVKQNIGSVPATRLGKIDAAIKSSLGL